MNAHLVKLSNGVSGLAIARCKLCLHRLLAHSVDLSENVLSNISQALPVLADKPVRKCAIMSADSFAKAAVPNLVPSSCNVASPQDLTSSPTSAESSGGWTVEMSAFEDGIFPGSQPP